MYIPDSHLPPITTVGNTPKLPSQIARHKNNRGVGSMTIPADKARFYYIEALADLALAKFWLDRAEE